MFLNFLSFSNSSHLSREMKASELRAKHCPRHPLVVRGEVRGRSVNLEGRGGVKGEVRGWSLDTEGRRGVRVFKNDRFKGGSGKGGDGDNVDKW